MVYIYLGHFLLYTDFITLVSKSSISVVMLLFSTAALCPDMVGWPCVIG